MIPSVWFLLLWSSIFALRPEKHESHMKEKELAHGHLKNETDSNQKGSNQTSDSTQLLMCQPICALCNDGLQMVIMRDMDQQQFIQMLAVQSTTTVAQTALNVIAPGGAIGAYLLNKALDQGIASALSALDDKLQGPDKCNAVGVLANSDEVLGDLTPFGTGFDLTEPTGWCYVALDAPNSGQRVGEGYNTSVVELDIWRKALDSALAEERASDVNWNMVTSMAQSVREWAIDEYVVLPSAYQQVISDSSLFCGDHGGVNETFLVGNAATWAIKNPGHFTTKSIKNSFDAAVQICEELYPKAPVIPKERL